MTLRRSAVALPCRTDKLTPGDCAWRNSTDGGWSARPSCWRSSAGASASTARRSILHAVREARGLSLGARLERRSPFTYLAGAFVAANVPALYRRFGLPAVTKAGALALAAGICGWADRARAVAAVRRDADQRRGLGRHGRRRDQRHRLALVRAHAAGRARHGLQRRELRRRRSSRRSGCSAIGTAGISGSRPRRSASPSSSPCGCSPSQFFARTPQQMGLAPDGDAAGAPAASVTSPRARPLPGPLLWRDFSFITLAAGIGARAVRADRPDHASLLAAGAGARRAMGRACDGRRHRRRHGRPHAGRLG